MRLKILMTLKNGHLILATALYNTTLPLNYILNSTNIRIRVKEKVLLSCNQDKLVFGKYIFMGSTSPFLSNLGVSINLIKDLPSQIPYYYIITNSNIQSFFLCSFSFFLIAYVLEFWMCKHSVLITIKKQEINRIN